MNNRDQQIVAALTEKVRLMTFSQLAATWWPPSATGSRNARRRLEQLHRQGLLCKLQVQAKPLLNLSQPLVHWVPGGPQPAFGSLAWTLWKRWQEPPRAVTVYFASKTAVNRVGGVATGSLHNLAAISHDLHVSQVYVHFLRMAPELADAWVGEDVLAPTRVGQKLPDAILHDGTGRPRLVIEFGGAYPRERLEAFHLDCLNRQLPYEIW